MALTLTSLRLLARANAREAFKGPILTLGRQGIYAPLEKCRAAIASVGEVHELPPGMERFTSMPAFGRAPFREFTSDACAFWLMCGQHVEALDISAHEGANHIHDLNLPVPDSLRGRFGTIVDGGTLEHVFDAAQVLRNVKAMLAPGGRVLHINPLSNWAEHGYYQFSPSFYHDFYQCNGFEMRECLLTAVTASDVDRLYSGRSPVWEWHPDRPSAPIISKRMMSIHFEAAKTHDIDDYTPLQGEARGNLRSSQLGGNAVPMGRLQRLLALLQSASPALGVLALPARRLLGRDLTIEPWGLNFIGRY